MNSTNKTAPAEVLISLGLMTLAPLIIACLHAGGAPSKFSWISTAVFMLIGFIMAVGTADRPHVSPYWQNMLK